MNIWHDMNPEKISPEKFMAVVEIPGGSKKKYEMDKETGMLRLDRILYTSTHYPANYGFIPRTYAEDGDPLDVLILCTENLDPMIMVDCYPIGVVRMMDGGKMDDKIIAIPLEDPTWNYYKDISALPPHIQSEIVHFFEVYKNLENLDTAASEILGREGAIQIIQEAMRVYERHFCGKMS
jgi:inorganic pyrophosphatase